MPRRFDSYGWNRQFKWQPCRTDRWDIFPKDRIPFVDDFSVANRLHRDSIRLPPIDDMDTETPGDLGPQDGGELLTPHVQTPWRNRQRPWQYPEPRMLLPYYRP